MTIRDRIIDFLMRKGWIEKRIIRRLIHLYLRIYPLISFLNPVFNWGRKLYISLFPLLGGVIIGHSWDDITKTPSNLLNNYFPLLILLVLWLVTLSWQFLSASNQFEKALVLVKNSILNAPDSRVINSYREYYRSINDTLIYGGAYRTENKKESLETDIKLASESLLKFIERYFRAYGVRLTSNFMIYFKMDETVLRYVEFIKSKELEKIIIFKNEPLEAYSGILLLCENLSFGLHDARHHYDPIVIPILKKNDTSGKLVPGATTAFRLGVSLISDTEKLKEMMKKFEEEDEQSVLSNIISKKIQSFISIGVKYNRKTIGVMNIDANVKLNDYISEYLTTLLSLIHPIVDKFGLSLSKYHNLVYKEYLERKSYEQEKK